MVALAIALHSGAHREIEDGQEWQYRQDRQRRQYWQYRQDRRYRKDQVTWRAREARSVVALAMAAHSGVQRLPMPFTLLNSDSTCKS